MVLKVKTVQLPDLLFSLPMQMPGVNLANIMKEFLYSMHNTCL
jgi:hypothetical protein